MNKLRATVVVIATAVVSLATYDLSTSASAQQAVRFSDTPAAQAFVAGDYSRALEEFARLREANPDNVLILRYLAITLDHLGRYDEAIGVYDEALTLAPSNAELHYHRGVTAYNAQSGEQAIASFKRAAELAPESQYAEFALQYLDAIAQQHVQQQPVGKPRRFGAYLLAGFQRDDNVPALPDDAPGIRDGDRYTAYVNFDYYVHQSPKWSLTASVNGYGTRYEDDLFDDFEIPQYMGSLSLQRTGSMARFPYVGSLTYDYRRVEHADGELYSLSDALTLGLRLTTTDNTATYGYYRYTDDDFEEEGFDPVFSSRDADNHLVGLRHSWFFADGLANLSAELNHERNIAEGVNFDMEGIGVTVSAAFPLPGKLRADLAVSYTEEDYDKFAGPVIRETTRRAVKLGLSRWFGKRLYVRLDYDRLEEESSYASLSFDRSVWGLSFSYVY